MANDASAVFLSDIAQRARSAFSTGVTLPVAHRLDRLRALESSIRTRERLILEAMMADLRKCEGEAYAAEIGLVYAELREAQKSLKRWMKPRGSAVPLALWPGAGAVVYEPLGVALILSPWNYPLMLALGPVVGAIAAGCTVVLKPSELSPHASKVVEEVLRGAFGDDGCVTVVQGGVEVASALLGEKWDIIFFTGSTQVGRVVMEAAAKHLTPVVLELGGKCPAIVVGDVDVDVEVTARRIAWGKAYNAGQSCVAPDYVLIQSGLRDVFLEELRRAWHQMFGDDIEQSPDYGRIIDQRHFERLVGLLSGGRVAVGGQSNSATRYIAPTALIDVQLDHPLMKEEVFGPLLPVIGVPDVDTALRFVNERPKPLALYVFTPDRATADRVLRSTSSGGAVVNDCVVQFAANLLPLGGVGHSGMGRSHGPYGFQAFSHLKTVIRRPHGLDVKVRYPPYSPMKVSLFRRLL